MNIVHGGRECVDALLTHPKVKAISFVGSTPVARHIYEVGTRHGKRVQSNGGAKNYVFIMPDADVENSTRGVIEAAYGCAGERCMAGSTAVVIGDASKPSCPQSSKPPAPSKSAPPTAKSSRTWGRSSPGSIATASSN
jgi:malonate-semialdehyde dehydrogenase (acetylating) / methylmalonate-semialdehyde dehydrogenase